MDMIEPLLKFSPSGIVTPPHWGVILAEGPDAGSFLQGQLTNDVLLLPAGQARFAGYCSAKGRLMASFIVLKVSNEKYLLVCHKDLLQSTVKRLSMFVMRAKLKLSDASEEFPLRGLLGETANSVCPTLKDAAPWQATHDEESSFIKLHSAYSAGLVVQRMLWIGTQDGQASNAFLSQPLAPVTQDDWQLAEVLSGISMVQLATSEAFVPQMLNHESVEGVSFKKGCYPGQEVVARSQFRGTLKRRAFIVSSPTPMQAGQEVFSSEDAEQACGTVASAVMHTPPSSTQAASWWGIVSMQISAASQSLYLAHDKGARVNMWALPYPLLEDI